MRYLVWVAAALAFAPGALAEVAAAEEAEAERVEYPSFRIGVGVSLASRPVVLLGDDASASGPITLGNLQIPVYLGEHLRLEAEFGMYAQSGSPLPGNALLGNLVELARIETHIYRLLLGIGWATPLGKSTILYLGPKVGLQSRSLEVARDVPTADPSEPTEEVAGKVKAVDFWLGGAVGGEAFLTDRFSLGLEVGFFYVSLGKSALSAIDEVRDERPGDEDAPWLLGTHGSIAARLYFL